MLCLNSFGKFLKKMATNSQNKLYDIIFPWHFLWFLFVSPVGTRKYWWVLPVILIGNYVVDSGLLLLGMLIFKAKQRGVSYLEVWKKSSMLIFMFGLVADFLGCLITDLFYYTGMRVFTEDMFNHRDNLVIRIFKPVFALFDEINKMIFSMWSNIFSNLSEDKTGQMIYGFVNFVGPGLLGASITCILIYVLNRYISFRRCEMDDKLKLKLAIFIAVLTTPWYFALPPMQ